MTPITSEREARELLAQIYDEQGSDIQAMHVREGSLDSTDRFAERCIIAALARQEAQGAAARKTYVTFENGHMKLDVNAWLSTPEGQEQVRRVCASAPATPPAPVDVRVLLQEARDQIYRLAGGFTISDQLIARIDRALLDGQPAGVEDYREIARLIGSIFFYGNFKAETSNERALEALLRKTGNFYETENDVLAALGGGGGR